MCTTCGCGQGETRIEGVVTEHEHSHTNADGTVHTHSHAHDLEHDHAHDGAYRPVAAHGHLHYGHGPAHAHAPGISQTRMVQIEQNILAKNDAYAAANRQRFAACGVLALNLVSSPGSGKTTLLVKTIEMLDGRLPLTVIEGDQQTSQDAERIRATGAQAVQINTGKGCHLDAAMVGRALDRLDPPENSVVMIENV
ncbi:MAG: hydrogenase nickel incorporation protein HypB, partial [Proteobacteria bacterium]|nr:hydrogenase nickel incorporation protein HypB [Pseudomonadota bacterium]